jgi:hypothetical protein
MPSGLREVCFQQDSLSCRIAKVSVKDGKEMVEPLAELSSTLVA